ncbi:MAG TPA: peptidoglycan DD-metalloendopeptidase family protein [Ignavibacteriaceae bacterium]|nr:peptidoglycan DD-metalloendopeptidase family protein [Ignavibacteriaceae bacterium]
MVKSFCKILLLLLIIPFTEIHLQEEPELNINQAKLTELRSQIEFLQKELELKSASEKESYSSIENLNNQNLILNKLIGELRSEEKNKQRQIELSLSNIATVENEIKKIKENYAAYIVAIYKRGSVSELESIVDASSLQQSLRRYVYLQRFSDSRKNDLQKLNEHKTELVKLKSKLENERQEKSLLAQQKAEEENSLLSKIGSQKKILSKIKNNKVSIQKEIEAKKQAEIQIKNMIVKLIEESQRRKKEEEERLARLKLEKEKSLVIEKTNETVVADIKKEKGSTTKTIPELDIDLNTEKFSSFAAMKGKLNWPITNGKIFRKFGENKNSKLNTVTLNYGIDIKASKDLNVKAVSDGVVSIIDYIPGFGSVLIISHKDEYRTVYSHLSQIFVKEGDKIKNGQLIATVGESLDGTILHFEIWNGRQNINPEIWLRK